MRLLCYYRRWRSAICLVVTSLLLVSCSTSVAPLVAVAASSPSITSPPLGTPVQLGTDPLTGDMQPVRDPSMLREAGTYYLFSSDIPGQTAAGNLLIRCSQNKVAWTLCGSVFSSIPDWVQAKIPGVSTMWAPDISYFNGTYHVYYSGSTLGSQQSVIGLATNTTLDSSDPKYQWVDQGEVLSSVAGDDFNALDPNILVAADNTVWLTYGSYWSGVKQQQVDPASGMLISNATRYDLATRPGILNNPIEGSSIVQHGGYYYLYTSIDYCCLGELSQDNYKEQVGRSSSPHGPFLDEDGVSMMDGGGTVLLTGNTTWAAPGGGTALVDPATGDSLIVFHAALLTENGAPYAWVKQVSWQADWPVLK